MVLKRPFFGATMEESILHIYYSGLPGDRASRQYEGFTEKMVLKRPLLSDTG